MTGQKGRSGGARLRAGRTPRYEKKPKYVKIPTPFYIQRSEREPLTPASDLSICLAEMDEGDTRRGVVIGEVWYGAEEALSIYKFLRDYRSWLEGQPE